MPIYLDNLETQKSLGYPIDTCHEFALTETRKYFEKRLAVFYSYYPSTYLLASVMRVTKNKTLEAAALPSTTALYKASSDLKSPIYSSTKPLP